HAGARCAHREQRAEPQAEQADVIGAGERAQLVGGAADVLDPALERRILVHLGRVSGAGVIEAQRLEAARAELLREQEQRAIAAHVLDAPAVADQDGGLARGADRLGAQAEQPTAGTEVEWLHRQAPAAAGSDTDSFAAPAEQAAAICASVPVITSRSSNFTPNVCLSFSATSTASSECPPTSSRRSLTPNASWPSTSRQISAIRSSTSVRGAFATTGASACENGSGNAPRSSTSTTRKCCGSRCEARPRSRSC